MIVEKRTPARSCFMVFNVLLMIGISVICILPILHVFMASISNPNRIDSYSGILVWPLPKATLAGYRYILHYKDLWVGYANTLFYVVTQCVISSISCVIAGYVLSRKRFEFRGVLMGYIAFTMLFQGGMMPTYMVIKDLHMLDTRAALLIPGMMSVFNIIIMRTAIASIPDSLEESARVDGAGELTVMFRVILPLCKATFAVIILFTAVMKWNEWFSAMLYLDDTTKYPLQMVLRKILVKQESFQTASEALDAMDNFKSLLKYCCIIVSTAPILCIYPFVQKYFVSGVMIGSVKG